MKMKRLGVNIDHIATIRNARGEDYPDPLRAALIAEESGAEQERAEKIRSMELLV